MVDQLTVRALQWALQPRGDAAEAAAELAELARGNRTALRRGLARLHDGPASPGSAAERARHYVRLALQTGDGTQ